MRFDSENKEIWHDYSLDKIVIEYTDIAVELEKDSITQRLVFKNYIAVDYIGQWDENIVKAIYEEKDSAFMKDALEKVSTHNNTKYKGGGTRDIHSDWKCIVIQLIDGICIRIVCDDIIVE